MQFHFQLEPWREPKHSKTTVNTKCPCTAATGIGLGDHIGTASLTVNIGTGTPKHVSNSGRKLLPHLQCGLTIGTETRKNSEPEACYRFSDETSKRRSDEVPNKDVRLYILGRLVYLEPQSTLAGQIIVSI